MRASPRGIRLITEFEGFPNGGRPYDDPTGVATVGYGHVIARRRVTAADRQAKWISHQHTPGALTPTEAEELLRRDLAPCEATISDLVRVPVTEGQFDAIASFVFNISTGNFAISAVLARLNAGDYQGAADAFLKWNHAGSPPVPLAGLTCRRERERARFLEDGGPDAGSPPGLGDGYTPAEIRWIRAYDQLLLERRDAPGRLQLRAAMTRQRKRIWKAAQPLAKGGDGRGWDCNARTRRYYSLLARTS